VADEPNAKDPLRDLLVDATAVDRDAIAAVLKGRIGIDSSSGRLVLSPSYNELDARRKVLSVLLARKAAHLLGLAENEGLTNKQVTELSGLAPGTAAPSLKSLKELRLASQDGAKAYYIPNAQLGNAIEFINAQRRERP
jgi:hypothetical protein